MNEMKTLPLAFTYVGVFLGAGFVSGPELWQFFGAMWVFCWRRCCLPCSAFCWCG
jgi:uncharacterized membrane protein YkvI